MYAIVWLHRSRMNNREIYVLNRDPFSSKCSLLCLLQMLFIQEISNVFRLREASTGGRCLGDYPGALALWSSHCKSFDHRVPADIIPRYPIFKWVTVTSWWRHQMETFSALLAICAGNSPVTGEFPAQRPVTRSFDVFFDLRLNKRLSKQSRGSRFETLPRPLWRHSNVIRRKGYLNGSPSNSHKVNHTLQGTFV